MYSNHRSLCHSMCRPGDSRRLEKKDQVEKRTEIGVIVYNLSAQNFQVVAVEVVGESYTLMVSFDGGMLPELYILRWQIADKIRVERRHHASTYFEVASLIRDINLVQTNNSVTESIISKQIAQVLS